jgi:prevent-host-death family protein
VMWSAMAEEQPFRGSIQDMAKTVSADEARAHLLDLLEEHTEFVITKDGEPVARVVPIEVASRGPMYGRIRFLGDVVAPLDETWKADQ